jgi:nucleotide-binding universal stress UspA family protein
LLDLLAKSNTPVLAVPADSHGFQAAGPALVAWDGSSPAAAALTAAVPLLKLASSVTILGVEDGSIESPAEEAASYLSRHDIHPNIVREETDNKKASDLVLAHAKSGRFTYLVMGGYGHLRFVEALFGGATQSVLNHSPIPVFLAH